MEWRNINDVIEPTIFIDSEGKNFTVSSFDLGMDSNEIFLSLDEAVESYISSIEVVKKEVKSSTYISINVVILYLGNV